MTADLSTCSSFPKLMNLHDVNIFVDACKNGNAGIVASSLAHFDMSPSALDECLAEASSNGHISIVKLLINDGRSDPSAKSSSSLYHACSNGHEKIVELLLWDGRADPSSSSNICLIDAAGNGHLKIVELLLKDHRVDPATSNSHAFLLACNNGRDAVVQALLQDGRSDPTSIANLAIRKAVEEGREGVVRLLLEDGRADPTAMQNQAIHFALCNDQYGTVELLLLSNHPVHSQASALLKACYTAELAMIKAPGDLDALLHGAEQFIRTTLREFGRLHKFGRMAVNLQQKFGKRLLMWRRLRQEGMLPEIIENHIIPIM